jgi:hypothetical protein
MENIQMFLEVCKKLGISEVERFTSIDLYEEKDVPKVINCLTAFEVNFPFVVTTYLKRGLQEKLALNLN